MADAELDAAVAAALGAVRSAGLSPAAPSVLENGSNVLVKAGSVVVRVATTTALIRPGVERWLARDVALARFAASRGLGVGPLDPALAGPHKIGGHAVTLWPFVAHTDEAVGGAVLARMLGELHAALREIPGASSVDHGPFADLTRVLTLLDEHDLAAGPLARLRERAADAAAEARRAFTGRPAQTLHGDAHDGNVLATRNGPMWIDFEDTWFGPAEWDVACLPADDTVLAAYPGDVDRAALAAAAELREVFGVCWSLLLARRFPAARSFAERWLAPE